MKKIEIADVDSHVSPGDVFRPLSAALGTTDVAINYYELAPGDSFGYCYHRHHEQEEVFYVQSGTATFDTADGEVEVAEGEVVRFAPGDFQQGTNRGDERVVALALGAPKDQGETELLRDCPECEERTPHAVAVREDGEVVTPRCLTCDTVTGRYTE